MPLCFSSISTIIKALNVSYRPPYRGHPERKEIAALYKKAAVSFFRFFGFLLPDETRPFPCFKIFYPLGGASAPFIGHPNEYTGSAKIKQFVRGFCHRRKETLILHPPAA
jgi:hypothetical protein